MKHYRETDCFPKIQTPPPLSPKTEALLEDHLEKRKWVTTKEGKLVLTPPSPDTERRILSTTQSKSRNKPASSLQLSTGSRDSTRKPLRRAERRAHADPALPQRHQTADPLRSRSAQNDKLDLQGWTADCKICTWHATEKGTRAGHMNLVHPEQKLDLDELREWKLTQCENCSKFLEVGQTHPEHECQNLKTPEPNKPSVTSCPGCQSEEASILNEQHNKDKVDENLHRELGLTRCTCKVCVPADAPHKQCAAGTVVSKKAPIQMNTEFNTPPPRKQSSQNNALMSELPVRSGIDSPTPQRTAQGRQGS